MSSSYSSIYFYFFFFLNSFSFYFIFNSLPEILGKFIIPLFPGNNFIGLTGTSNDSSEIKDIMKKFKIYASKIEYEEED